MAAENTELVNLNVIRSETVLSRYPIHRLSKRGSIEIEIRKKSEDGETIFQWEVSPTRKYGEPGPLAYKLDTLLINRRIEEAEKPVPKIIRLGSLTDICRELDIQTSGNNTNQIKKALLQNAFAAITAKLTYRTQDGTERHFKFGDTRYGVIFTGENLPLGPKADAVYIILHDLYRELLNSAPTRPLDFNYLRDLPPMAQRFYELLSFQMYAALKNNRPRAKFLYSEFCIYAPQTRYFGFEQVKKQMFKVHTPHRETDYIAKIEYVETVDGEGKPDWIMYYTPGAKAKAEFKAFTNRRRDNATKSAQAITRSNPLPLIAAPIPEVLDEEDERLVIQLCSAHIAEITARELVREHRQAVELQLHSLPYRDRSTIRDLASWLVKAIRENYAVPEIMIQTQQKEATRKKAREREILEETRKRHEEFYDEAYTDYLDTRITEIKTTYPDVYAAFDEATKEERQKLFGLIAPNTIIGRKIFQSIACSYFNNHSVCSILDFWNWDTQCNPTPFCHK